jgi:hypothetical protein
MKLEVRLRPQAPEYIDKVLHSSEFLDPAKVWQSMINKGQVWRIEGWYGRRAVEMIEEGLLMLGKQSRVNYYGTTVPSRTDVEIDAPGSYGYVVRIMGREYADIIDAVMEEYDVNDLPDDDD